ncbi:hypothetical protein EG68_04024 [Paragonimus skrjabini miyazakii]|uniref:Protein kinase domain-containing protein n=1 Tax=Paragonimus skrjabini miyazakii TaxID=59628 RepID=A0A8S9YZU1_9TREM|nr:hypothetical protein EG68_04024 [Paragonimus skrjabini miyazakii]
MDAVLCRGEGTLQACVLTRNVELLRSHLKNGKLPPLSILVYFTGVNVNSVNRFNESALFVAAYYGENEILQLLLDHEADPNTTTIEGNTALHACAYNNHVKCIEILLKAGADKTVRNKNGSTAISVLKDNNFRLTVNDSTKTKINEANKKLASCSSSTIFKLSKWKNNGNGTSKPKNVRMLSNDFGHFLLDESQVQKYITTIPVVSGEEIVDETRAAYVSEHHSYRFVESKRWRGVSVSVHKVDMERLTNSPVTAELKSIFQRQLARELRIVSRLQHPHIRSPLALLVDSNLDLRVVDSTRIALVYERPSLGSLYHFKQIQLEDLPVLPALTICRQIAEALQFLHSYCMVHCNVTPHAIHLFSIDHAKLGNFEHTVQLSPPVNLTSTVHSTWNKVSSRETSSPKVVCVGLQQPNAKCAPNAVPPPTTVFQCAYHLLSKDLAEWLPPELYVHSDGKSSLLQKPVNLHKPTYVSDVYGLAKVLQFVLPPIEYGPLNGDWDHTAYSVPITNAKMVIEAALQPCPEERLPLKQFHRLLIHLFWNEYDQHTSPKPVVSRPSPCPLRLCGHKLTNCSAEHVPSKKMSSPAASTSSDRCETFNQHSLFSDQTELDTHYVTVRRRRVRGFQSPSLRSPSDSSVQCVGTSWTRHNFFQANSAVSSSFATSLSSTEPLAHSDGLTTLPSSMSSSEANTPKIPNCGSTQQTSFGMPNYHLTGVQCESLKTIECDSTNIKRTPTCQNDVRPELSRRGVNSPTTTPMNDSESLKKTSDVLVAYRPASQRTKSKISETAHSISARSEIEKSRHVVIKQIPLVDVSPSSSCLKISENCLNSSRSAKLSRADYVHLAAVPLLPEGVDVPKQLVPWRCPSVSRLTRSNTLPLKSTRSRSDLKDAFVNSVTEYGARRDTTPMKPASHLTYLLRTPLNYTEVTGKLDLIQFSSQRLRRLRRSMTSIALSRSEDNAQNHHDTFEAVSQFHKPLYHSTSFSALMKVHVATQTETTLSQSVLDGAVGDGIHTELSTSTVSRYEMNPVSCFSLIPDTTGERNKLPESMSGQKESRVFKMIKLFECQSNLSPSYTTNNKTPLQNTWIPKVELKDLSSSANDTPITRLADSEAPKLHDVNSSQLMDKQKDGVVTHRISSSTFDFDNSDVIDAKPTKPDGSGTGNEHRKPGCQLASSVNVQISAPENIHVRRSISATDVTTQVETEIVKPLDHGLKSVWKKLNLRELPDKSAHVEPERVMIQSGLWRSVQISPPSTSTKTKITEKRCAIQTARPPQKNGLGPSTLLNLQEPEDISSFRKLIPTLSPLKAVGDSLFLSEQSSDCLQADKRNPVDQSPLRPSDADRKGSVGDDISSAAPNSRLSNDEKYFSFITIPLWSCAARDFCSPHNHQNGVVLKHTTDNCESISPPITEKKMSDSIVQAKLIPAQDIVHEVRQLVEDKENWLRCQTNQEVSEKSVRTGNSATHYSLQCL